MGINKEVPEDPRDQQMPLASNARYAFMFIANKIVPNEIVIPPLGKEGFLICKFKELPQYFQDNFEEIQKALVTDNLYKKRFLTMYAHGEQNKCVYIYEHESYNKNCGKTEA